MKRVVKAIEDFTNEEFERLNKVCNKFIQIAMSPHNAKEIKHSLETEFHNEGFIFDVFFDLSIPKINISLNTLETKKRRKLLEV